MIVDPLTNGLPPKVFHEHTAHMGVVSLQDMSFFSGNLYFRCFYLYIHLLWILWILRLFNAVKYSVFIHSDFVCLISLRFKED